MDKSDPVKLVNHKLNCLLYADDLVLLSSTKEGMQSCLDELSTYCNKWYLQVNLEKTKCMTFNTLGRIVTCKFNFEGKIIEDMKNITYLGVTISASGCFTEAKNIIFKKGLKAYFKLCKSMGEYKPSISTFLHVFDHTVKPVLMYGSEIWGTFSQGRLKSDDSFYKLCNDFLIEKLNIKACKFILGLNKRCTNAAARGELGRYPFLFNVIINIINYWIRLKNSGGVLLKEALMLSEELHKNNKNSWITCVYSILDFLKITEKDIFAKKK